jgi:transcriptional regulator with XRE-family HTH domain
MDSRKLSDFVSERRKKIGKSQNDLANNVHYTNQAISSFEKGKTSPSISILPSLADFLELSLDDLLAENPNPQPLSGKNPSFDEEKIRKNIIALRTSRALSQGEEGKLLGVSRRTVIHYEKGSSIPSLDVMEKLLQYYQIPCSVFFYEDLEETLGAPKKKAAPFSNKNILFFFMGLFVGGGILSAILVPLSMRGEGKISSSSAPYQIGSESSTSSSNNGSGDTSASTAIAGLSKMVIITTAGNARNAGVYVGSSITLTLYTETTFDFTEATKTAYDLSWEIIEPYGDVSGVHLNEASPYPCETLSVDSGSKAGANFVVVAHLKSKTNSNVYFDSAKDFAVTIYQ